MDIAKFSSSLASLYLIVIITSIWYTMLRSFKQDLLLGQHYEIIASELITKQFNVTITERNNDYKYDFRTSDASKYEVKADLLSNKTGSFFVEYEYKDKASGIKTSESDYYIFIDESTIHVIKTSKLRNIIKKNRIDKVVKLIYARNCYTKAYLIPCQLIIAGCVWFDSYT